MSALEDQPRGELEDGVGEEAPGGKETGKTSQFSKELMGGRW